MVRTTIKTATTWPLVLVKQQEGINLVGNFRLKYRNDGENVVFLGTRPIILLLGSSVRVVRPEGTGNCQRKCLAKKRRDSGARGVFQMNMSVPEFTACPYLPAGVKGTRERSLPTVLVLSASPSQLPALPCCASWPWLEGHSSPVPGWKPEPPNTLRWVFLPALTRSIWPQPISLTSVSPLRK